MSDEATPIYPSIDRPWKKYYSEEALNAPIPEFTLYQFLIKDYKNHMDNTALLYYGKKIGYRELINQIEKTASAYSALGIAKGDIVTGITPSLPEVIFSFYALNKLGAVSNWLDPRLDVDTISNDLKITGTKVLLLFENFYEKFRPIADKLHIRVILFSAEDSLPFAAKAVMGLKDHIHADKSLYYRNVIKQYGSAPVETVDFTPNQIAVLEHTGGTTGKSKPVMLSNENINSLLTQYCSCVKHFDPSHSWLTVAFPFTAYSLIASQHLPLCVGMTCVLCYDMQLDKVEALFLKNRTNHIANTPVMWEHLINSEHAQKTDFSFLINPMVGADTLNIEKEKQINSFLSSHGCAYPISKGYGMTELSSGVTACYSRACNKLGSVGIPLPKTTVSIFDTETGEEVPCGNQGEICISGPTVMLGYYKNPEETERVLKLHADGRIWMHSGDVGHMDEDGCLFIDGRIKRMLIDHHGFKIFAPAIETTLQRVPGVEKSCVVGIKDRDYESGQVPVAFIVKNGTVAEDVLLDTLKERCQAELPEYFIPAKYFFVKSLPYTSAAKVDYRVLEKEAERKI